MLNIAIAKGRILKEALPLLARAGIVPLEDAEKSRKLIIPTKNNVANIIIIRATDVPTYVEYGAAELGIVGKDVLMEYGDQKFFEPIDLKIGQCRLMVAGIKNQTPKSHRIRVATKFSNITKRYFVEQGRQFDLIKLYGSMELAPLVGLADQIVDLVDTGNTLLANGLEPLELIATISTRLIVNKAAMKLKRESIMMLMENLESIIEDGSYLK